MKIKLEVFLNVKGEEVFKIYKNKNIIFTKDEMDIINEQIINCFSPFIYKFLNPNYHNQRIISPLIVSYIQILNHDKEIKEIILSSIYIYLFINNF